MKDDFHFLIEPILKHEDSEKIPGTTNLGESWEQSMQIHSIDDLRIIGTLGIGAYGAVTLVQDPATQETYACKKMFKDRIIQSSHQKRIQKEKNIMKCIKSNFIISLKSTFQDKTAVYLFMEVGLGGELYSLL